MPLQAILIPRRTAARPVAALLTLTMAYGAAGANGEIDDASLGVPGVAPCSQRYALVGAPQPGSDGDIERAIRQGFDSRRHWGTEENVEHLGAAETGVDEPGLRVHYPAGSSNPGSDPRGGAGFYTSPAALEGAERACLQYRVRFAEDFDYVKGGKLPGLYGGDAPSGGEEVNGENGFSMRLMWREHGQGELYEYVLDQEGASVGRGRWSFPAGEWITVEQELLLNAPDRADGVARLWIDGRPVLEQRDIVYRTTPEVTIDGLMFSTFFGGSGGEWRTPRDQHADFAAFRLYRPAP